MHSLSEWIETTWAEMIRETPLLNVWQFAQEEIAFDQKMGNITGPYRPDLTPFNKLFQEAITSHWSSIPEEDWWLRELVARGEKCDEAFYVKSSQSGVTQAALNGCIYLPLHDPGRLLYALPSREKAKNLVRVRVIPFLRALCGNVIEDENDVNLTFIELTNMIMEFGGSFSSAFFSEKPLRFGFADDVEYMVSEGGVPGLLDGVHVIDHIRSRFTTSDNSFMGIFSKPNLESSQFIWNWRGGSQHSFRVPCPLCGGRQVLEPEGLNYDLPGCKDLAGRYDLEAVEALTRYRCQHCKENIVEEDSKYQMNLAGIMVPKSREARAKDEDPPLVPRRLSMRINDLNSPFPKVKWGILARLKIEAENNPEKLKHVVTNHWARPWRVKAINLRADQIRALCAGAIDPKTSKPFDDRIRAYKRGEVPFIPAALTLSIDRQGDRKKWIICAWKADGTCAVIEYGACLSDRDILDMLDDPRAHDGSPVICLADPDRPLVIFCGLYDSGFEHTDVYDTCIASGWRIYPSKGAGGLTTGGRLVEGKDDFYEGEPILRYHYHDSQLKVHFYKYKIEKRTDPRLWLPSDVDDEFVVELISESLGPKRLSSNTKIMEWQHDSKIGPNDYGDAGKMQYVIWQIIGPQIQAEEQERLAELAAQTPDAGGQSPPPGLTQQQ